MKRSQAARVEQLEAKRANTVLLSDVSSFLLAVLQVVEEEAGQQMAGRCAGQLVSRQARRVAALRGEL